jgi:hypothetical protein
MSVPPLLLALSLLAAVDAGTQLVAPVTALPRTAQPAPEPAASARPLDVSQMPFTPDSISQVVHAHQQQIQDCYEKTLAARDETLEGRLMTHFIITPQGTVKSAQVVKKQTTLKDKSLHACMVGVLSKLNFPKPPDKKDHPVEYPFNLKAVE